jgi:hypothetical protein
MPVSYAIRKYGSKNFTIELLAECSSQKDLDKWEIFYVNNLDTWSPKGYNLKAGQGRGIVSDETKKKLSELGKGRKLSEATKEKLRKASTGYKRPEKHLKAQRERMKGKKPCALAQANSIKSSQKTYKLIDPLGNHIIVINMAKYCRENNLNKFKMCELVRGRREIHKGYCATNEAPL